MNHTFDTPTPVDLHVDLNRGRVTVAAEQTGTTEVTVSGEHAEEVSVHQDGNEIHVVGPRGRLGFFSSDPEYAVRVVLPLDSNLTIRTGSADVSVSGRVGAGHLKSGSGEVEVQETSGPINVETGSGDIHLHQPGAEVRIKSGSGDVSIGSTAAAVSISTGSGDVELGSAAGPTVIKTGSGDLRVATADGDLSMATGSGDSHVSRLNRGRFSVKGASGDVTVGIPAGVPVWTDITALSGRVRSDLAGAGEPADGQDFIELRATTVSGDITLHQL